MFVSICEALGVSGVSCEGVIVLLIEKYVCCNCTCYCKRNKRRGVTDTKENVTRFSERLGFGYKGKVPFATRH